MSSATVSVADVAARAERVRERIVAAGGDLVRIRIVAVTKGFGPEAVQAAVAAGLHDVGESYAQELLAKAEVLSCEPAPTVHFVGRVQTNKVRKIAPLVSLWHSVDRIALGAEIAKRAPGAAVLAQVNLSGEESKAGGPPDETAAFVTALRDLGLDVRGLMTIGPMGPAEAARPAFRTLRRLADQLELVERSMGMTDDLEVAVEEGTTMVRVGTALFGPRPRTAEVGH
jgi:PLP dependent protein